MSQVGRYDVGISGDNYLLFVSFAMAARYHLSPSMLFVTDESCIVSLLACPALVVADLGESRFEGAQYACACTLYFF